MTAEQPLTAEHWLTYAEAAERLGLTPEAVRALARRQHWPRRSPNAVGGQTWILVPADRLAAAVTNGHAESGRQTPPGSGRRANPQESALAAGQNDDDQRTPPGVSPDIGSHYGRRIPPDIEGSDRRMNEILTAVRKVAETFAQPLWDQLGIANQQIETLTMQLGMANERGDRERDRADRAEARAREAETRVKEVQDQLQAEMIEHRRVVGMLAEQLSTRRSWWPWRRR